VATPIFVNFVAGLGGFMSGLAGAEAGIIKLARSGEGSMASLSKAAPIMGAAVLGAGLAIAGTAVKMAGDFQQSMTKLATTAGESQGNLKMVGDGILTMAGQVGISADELAKGMYTVESAGYHGADALTVLKASAQGARQENADLGKVTDAVSTALRDYHLPASDAGKVTSQLVTAVSHGKTTFDELTGALHSVTPIASAAGVSLADATGVLSSMTASGMSAQQASQNLGSTIGRLAAMTQPMVKELGALGLNAADLSKNLGQKGVAGTMQEISTAILQHMGPAGTTLLDTMNQSTQAGTNAKKMFDSLPPALQAVAEKYKSGELDLSKYKHEIKGVPGDQRMLINSWKLMTDRANGFSQALKSGSNDSQTYISALKQATGGQEGLTVALQSTGENAAATNAAIKDIAEASTQADGNIKGWDEVQGNFNQKMAELHATIGSLMIRLGTVLLPTVTKVADAFLSFTRFLTEHKAAAIAAGVVIGVVLVAAIVAVTAATVAWTIATLANPVVWLVIGITAAVVALGYVIYELVTHWDQVWSKIKDITADVGRFLSDRWNAMKSDAMAIWNAITGFLADRWNAMVSDAMHIWNSITGFLADRWNAMRSDAMAGVRSVIDQVKDAWHTVQNWTITAWTVVTKVLSDAWHAMTRAAVMGVAATVAPLVAAWQWVEHITSTVWNGISSFFMKWWPLLLGIFAPGIFIALAIWNHFHTQITDTVVGVWTGVKTFLSDAWNWITGTAQTAWNLYRDYIVNPITEAGHWVTDRIAALAGWLNTTWLQIAATADLSWKIIRDTVTAIVDSTVGWIMDRWNAAAGSLSGAWNNIVEFARDRWNAMRSDAMAIWNSITGFLSGAWNNIVEFARDRWNAAYNDAVGAWNNIVGAVSNAVNAVLGVLWRVGGDIAHAIWQPIDDGLRYVMSMVQNAENIGWNIIMGIANGVQRAAGALVNAVSGVLNSALGGAKALLGISSPSVVFAELVGAPISQGIAAGIHGDSHLIDNALGVVTKPYTLSGGSAFSGGGSPGAMGGQGATIVVNVAQGGTYYGLGGKEQAARDIRDELLRMQQRSPLGFQAA